MDVRNCRSCGRLYNYIGGGESICPLCIEELNKKFTTVKAYIRENPRATMPEISRDNDVTVKQIERWVREERLVFGEDSPIGIECEACGAMIKSGRFCAKCKQELQHNINDLLPKKQEQMRKAKEEKARERMRFLGN